MRKSDIKDQIESNKGRKVMHPAEQYGLDAQ